MSKGQNTKKVVKKEPTKTKKEKKADKREKKSNDVSKAKFSPLK